MIALKLSYHIHTNNYNKNSITPALSLKVVSAKSLLEQESLHLPVKGKEGRIQSSFSRRKCQSLGAATERNSKNRKSRKAPIAGERKLLNALEKIFL